ncbi:DUF4340 domain-containing protein [Hyphomicrobium sp. CS1GBMeth3]|uniref:DUF4340 domain-containing protein n=1 Tax=Hyphomicrobium sp. CS1GBMeth3 TaxID=1892845 RepID=UPI00093044BA|nr:DUF4340 domain-containing protein [Hyphomicrobium sp. CS1GBMeth3]
MTPKQFATLATVAAASLAAAVVVHAMRSPWTAETSNAGKLLPGLASEAANVARIAVTQGGTSVALKKEGDAWKVESQNGYPASAEKVRALLISLTEASLLEPKTRLAERYTLLEVDDPAGKTSNARLIKLEDAGGKTIAEVIAGKQRPGNVTSTGAAAAAATYVRRPGEEQSWLASTSIQGGAALKDWVNPRAFETQTEKIASLTVAVEGEPPYKLKRVDGGSHELESIPAGKKIKYVNLVDNIVEAASFLDFERVRKATGSTGGKAGTVTFETDDKLKIALNVRRDKDAVWIMVEPSGEGDAKKVADDIRARTDGWEFEVIPSKADTMLKKQADLLEDIAAETQDGPQAAPGPGMPPGMPPIPGMPGSPPATP